MTYPDHFQKQLDVIFNCAPGPHEIRILNPRYRVIVDGQPRDYQYGKGFSIGAPKNTKEATKLVNAHFNKGIPPHNCYIVLNRVSDNYSIYTKTRKIGDEWYPAVGTDLTTEEQIRVYCSLAIDLDRTNKTNSQGEKQVASEDELAHLEKVMGMVHTDLAQFELFPNYCLMSGNGFQMVYFFEGQNDVKKTKGIVATILHGLHAKYLKADVDIDTSLSDPPRVVRLADTWNMKDWKEDPSEKRVIRQAYMVGEPRFEINFYQNIKKLEESLLPLAEQYQSKKTEKPINDRKKPKTYSIPQQNNGNGNWIDDQLRLGGRELLIRALQQVHNSIHMKGESNGKPQLLCPYHNDTHPSAWIAENSNGVAMIHCKTDTCSLHSNSKTALGVLLDDGWDFKEACRELFGEMPPILCKHCGKEIIFEGESKRPLNPDHSLHTCEEYRKQKKQDSIPDKQKEQKKQDSIPEKTENSDERPTILLEGDLEIKSREILAWVDAHNTPPCIFIRGREIVRLVQIEGENKRTKQTVIERMDGKKLRAFLNERIRFEKEITKKDEIVVVTADLPLSVADHILARASWPFPDLMEVIRNPSLGCDGNLVLTDGYKPTMQAWVDLAGFNVELAENPTEQAVEAAKDLILNDLLRDFPFTDQASLANAVGLGLLPFVRHLIDGCTPLHLITSPVPGTGKSLLSDVLSWVATGTLPISLTEGRCDDEWRKRITAVLERSPAIIRIDNVTQSLDTGVLSSVLTTKIWSDRRLGATAIITVRNNAVWTVTANNPQLNMEVARRSVWISLDPKVAQPWNRSGFKHDPILKWVKKNREFLVKAFLTLAQAWVKKGMPKADVRMGSFEEWAEIVGGILNTVGIEGFLANHQKLYLRADTEMKEWRAFIGLWWQHCAEQPVAVRELRSLACRNDLLSLILGEKNEMSQLVKLAKALKQMQDRIVDCWKVEEASPDTHSHSNMWKLVKVKENGIERTS